VDGDLTEPVSRLFPLVSPEPAPDCAACTALAERRRRARAEGDGSAVVDCNVLLRQHPEHTGGVG
jgi:hypothetical protein